MTSNCGRTCSSGKRLVLLLGEFVVVQTAEAGERVHAVQSEVFLELRQAEEPLQRGLFHLVHVAEAHVVFNERNDLRGLFEREAHPPQDPFSDANADLDVAVEANPIGRAAKGRGLSDIMQQRTPGECRRRVGRKLFEQQQSVNPDIALRMKLGRLLDAVHLRDLRKHLLQ